MVKKLDIREAKNRVNRIDNLLEYYLGKKERELNKILPKSANLNIELVEGGSREDRYINYASVCEKYDPIINELYEEKFALEQFIEKELKRLNQYDEVEQLIVYYKEIYTPQKKLEKTWDWIAGQVHYSKTQCRRIYREYKKKRNI